MHHCYMQTPRKQYKKRNKSLFHSFSAQEYRFKKLPKMQEALTIPVLDWGARDEGYSPYFVPLCGLKIQILIPHVWDNTVFPNSRSFGL